jgi:hypothetical protein
MNQAAHDISNRLRSLSRDQLLRLGPEALAEVESFLQAAEHRRIDSLLARPVASFEEGPLLWLTQYTKTENPQYEAQGLPFLAPFPQKDYFKLLFEEFLARHPILAIAKSRTMMTSWAAAGFAAWCGQWRNEETVIQTLNVDRALHAVDYVRQLVDNQEPWLSELHPLEKKSAFTISWKGGGEVAAIPSGADAIRAFHPTTYLQDESAFLAEGEEALNAVLPTGARIICISTAHSGWFGDLFSL